MIRTLINAVPGPSRPVGWLLCAAIFCGDAVAQDWQLIDPFGQDLTPRLPTANLEDLANVAIDPALLDIVRQLDEPAFDRREAAAQSIIERAGDKTQLYAILDHGNLTVEQRYRLLQVVREFLLDMPRGAVGISMDGWQPGMALQGAGVRVADLVPGMPAERVLQVGDRIVAIDGQALATQNDLLVYVQSKRPGDKVMMRVQRARLDDRGDLVLDERNQPVTEELNLELELGSVEMLQNARQRDLRPSPVAAQRAREAAEVADQFAPSATAVRVTGENGQAFAFTATDGVDDTPEPTDRRVETHYLVRNLMRDFDLIDNGRISQTPELRRRWFQDLQNFMQVTAEADLDEEMRILHQQIITRYSQLLNARVQKVIPVP